MRSRDKRRQRSAGVQAAVAPAAGAGRAGLPAPEPGLGSDSDAAHLARLYGHIYELVRRIPAGRVATYGQVAELAGMPGAARVVGAAMRANQPAFGVPWQRVVGKRSRGIAQVSIHDPVGAAVQRGLLEDEGVVFSASGGIALRDHGWIPEEQGPSAGRGQRRAPGKTARPQARGRKSKAEQP